MSLTDEEITEFIEKDKELSSILHPIGKVYVPSGLDEIQLLLLSSYLRLMIRGTYLNLERTQMTPYREIHYGPLEEIRDIFGYLGGDITTFESNFNLALSEGIVGSRRMHDNEIGKVVEFPTISGNNGYVELQSILGKISEGKSRLIVKGTKYLSKMNFIEFLNELKTLQGIRVSDTYIDSMTLFPFYSMNRKPKELKILTSKITESASAFKTNMIEFTKETRISLEIRQTKDIHDRYIISDDEAWSIGASIKDLGSKDSIISKTENVRDSLADLFELRWASGAPF